MKKYYTNRLNNKSSFGLNLIIISYLNKQLGFFSMLKNFGKINIVIVVLLLICNISTAQKPQQILKFNKLESYVTYFNALDNEAVKNFVPNNQAFKWLSDNIPQFECPDTTLQQMYYYRWWSFRKHLVKTPDGFIFTEFITPVKFAGIYNTISSALGHQIYEGRWLRNPQYINDYISFWLFVDKKQAKPHFHSFSSWIDDAVYQRYLVNPDKTFLKQLLPALDADYKLWETERQLANHLFWQFDVRDAMEESISGSRKDKNIRPTINSYMYGNAKALAKMAGLLGYDTLREKYSQKAKQLKILMDKNLWDGKASFFKVRLADGKLSDAREAIGFIPWYFNLPDDKPKYASQWNQLIDTAGFNAPWGLTTAERRHPKFRSHGVGKCEWDGAIWPFATTQDLKGLANLLTNYTNHGKMNDHVFYDALDKYARSQQMNGKPYIGEYQDEKTGYWLKGDIPRSTFYNHSGFADLVINDLIGLKPRIDNILEIYPLIPQNQWDWFCLDRIYYHGHDITILWDKFGTKYHKGKGFHIYSDGKDIMHTDKLEHIHTKLIN